MDAAQADSNNTALCFAASGITDLLNDSVVLQIDTTCVAKLITGEAAITNNYVDFKGLKIIDDYGHLKNDFTFVRFRPVQVPEFKPYISYTIEVVRINADKTESVRSVSGFVYPCPRYCPRG